MSRQIDWLPALAFVVFGAVFFYESFQIVTFGMGSGGTIVPRAASGLVFVLAVIQFVLILRNPASDTTDAIVLREFALHSGPIILLGVVYGLLHIGFGYLAATFACAVLAFRLFENTWKTALIHSAAATATLYLMFVKVLGVYDPPGRVFDISGWL